MKTILALLLTVVGLSCFAAPGQPYFSKNQAVESELPPGIKFWFTAKDLPDGQVLEWVDRVAGTYFWQTNITNAPVKDGLGVHFNIGNETNQFLFATNGFGNTMIPNPNTEPFLVVFQYSSFITPSNAYGYNSRLLLGQDYAGGEVLIGAFAPINSSTNVGYLDNPVGQFYIPIIPGTIDIISAPKSASPQRWYATKNGTIIIPDTQPWNGTPYILNVGRSWNTSINQYIYSACTLMEFICWTNATGANIWTTNTLAKVHHYATTNWNFSP